MTRTHGPASLSPRLATVVAVSAVSVVLAVAGPPAPAATAASTVKVNFQPAATPPPSGYLVDSGQGFDAARGYGWVGYHDELPVDLTANTRYGWDATTGFTTLLQMQQRGTGGVVTGGRWEYALANGTYAVTVTAGDARKRSDGTYCCLDSVHRLTVEGVLAVDDFIPTTAQPLITATVTVAVADGRLTIDPVGGDNTKIDRVTVATSNGVPQQPTPEVIGVTPARSATGVPLNMSVSLAVNMPIDPATLGPSSMVVRGPDGTVAGGYNSDAAGGTASFTPSKNLNSAATYTVSVTSGLLSAAGVPFAPFTSSFTTGTSTPPLATTAFSKVASTPVPKPDVVALGPDGKLYVGTQSGRLFRYGRAADGTLVNPESITPFGTRVITGLAFDPASPTTLWVSNNYPYYTNAPRMSGHISRLTIPAGQALSAAVGSDVMVGLPRSAHDHMTNGLAFGPDGKLYVAQGANTAYGATDPYWGARGESPLSASILVADVHNATVFPSGKVVDVNTDPVGTVEDVGSDPAAGYGAAAANAPVRVYATGTRNPFTLLWAGGRLYAPVNESAAGGATPAGPGGVPPSATNVQAYTDYVTRIVAGRYYGHPNPAQGHFALNGGNPTAAVDPYEVTEYPVGTVPDPTWTAPDLALGVHRSPDGALLYGNAAAFGGALQGKLLVTEYSDGDDLLAVTLDSSGKPVKELTIPDAAQPGQALLFDNPLGIASDAATGVVYVAEGQSESSSTAGQVTVVKPAVTTSGGPPSSLHVNFQPASVVAPAGYTADTGQAYNGTSGWQSGSGVPLDLTANTRVRHSVLSPDVLHDTQILMQAPAGSGNTTPGQYVAALANGTYNLTVTVGDPTATNSVDEIVAQPGTADAVVAIDHFVPTAGSYWQTRTVTVRVTNGRLVLSPTGGSNTKLDAIVAVPSG